MKKILSIVLLAISTMTMANGVKFESISLSEVKEKACIENKLIFVDVFTSCNWLSTKVLTNDSVGEFMNKTYVNLKINAELDTAFAKQYKVTKYPTLLVLNSNGEELNRMVGAPDVATLLKWGKTSSNPSKLKLVKEVYKAMQTNNWKGYATSGLALIKQFLGKEGNLEGINNICWDVFVNIKDEELLKEYARVASILTNTKDPHYLDTYANLLYVADEKENAIKVEEQVIKLLEKNPQKDFMVEEAKITLEKFKN